MSETRSVQAIRVQGAEPPRVPALLDRPAGAPRALLVLAHGAGAGMAHGFMEALARRLADRGVAVLRFNFPYMERGGFPPDRPPVATATVRGAVARGRELVAAGGALGAAPIFAGGKSFGGRMTSEAAANGGLEGVRGIVFFGFPLHSRRKPATERAEHLTRVRLPMLFLQGTRDDLADLELLRPVVDDLDDLDGWAELHVVDGADHGFHVLKRSGRTDEDVLDELADEAVRWMGERA